MDIEIDGVCYPNYSFKQCPINSSMGIIISTDAYYMDDDKRIGIGLASKAVYKLQIDQEIYAMRRGLKYF